MQTDLFQTLCQMGLEKVEAEVYLFLLRADAHTAYVIAKAIGRPPTNVYKAVGGLARKGAVMVESGEKQMFRAVPPDEFVRVRERAIQEQARRAIATLSDFQRDTQDPSVYRIDHFDTVLERCRGMLQRAQRTVLVQAFPRMLAEVLPSLRHAVERGVAVRLQAFQPTTLPGADVVVVEARDESQPGGTDERLNVVMDSEEVLQSLIDAETRYVKFAIWSGSPYLASLAYTGQLSEHLLHGQRLVAHATSTRMNETTRGGQATLAGRDGPRPQGAACLPALAPEARVPSLHRG